MQKILNGKCTDPCDCWHPPVCQNYKSESGCKFGDICLFRHSEVDGQPKKKVASLKESIQLGCVSQDTVPPKKLFHGKVEKWDQIAPSQSPKGTLHHTKMGEKRVHRKRVIQKCEPQERNPCAPKCEDKTLQENLSTRTLHQQRSMGLCEKCLKAQNKGQCHVLLPAEAWVMPAPSSKTARRTIIRGR